MSSTNPQMSFLDVMACGLGSLLFLCFLFLSTKSNLSFDSKQNQKGKASSTIILVYTNSKEPCFSSKENHCMAKSLKKFSHHSTQYFTAIYAPHLQDDESIYIKHLKQDIPINIQIFYGGKEKVRLMDIKPVDLGKSYKKNMLQVWPVYFGDSSNE